MNNASRAVLVGVGTLALAMAPLSVASARDHGFGGHHGDRGHGLWLGAALAGAVVGLVTLPLQIVSAVVDPVRQRERADYYGPRSEDYPQYARDYAPSRRYYREPRREYGPPDAGYAAPEAYYRPPNAYYAPRQSDYDDPRGYAPPRSRYYDYNR
jgi:hypothetical protein